MLHSTVIKGQVNNNGPKYQFRDIDSLLELAQEKITIYDKDWDDIARQHYLQGLDRFKNGDSLKLKFYSLTKTKARTGDPTIIPAVAKAKMT